MDNKRGDNKVQQVNRTFRHQHDLTQVAAAPLTLSGSQVRAGTSHSLRSSQINRENKAELNLTQMYKKNVLDQKKEYGKIMFFEKHVRAEEDFLKQEKLFDFRVGHSDIINVKTNKKTWLIPIVPDVQNTRVSHNFQKFLLLQFLPVADYNGTEIFIHPSKRDKSLMNSDLSFINIMHQYGFIKETYQNIGDEYHGSMRKITVITGQGVRGETLVPPPKTREEAIRYLNQDPLPVSTGAGNKTPIKEDTTVTTQKRSLSPVVTPLLAESRELPIKTEARTRSPKVLLLGAAQYTRKHIIENYGNPPVIPKHKDTSRNYAMKVKTPLDDVYYNGSSTNLGNTSFFISTRAGELLGMNILECLQLDGSQYKYIPTTSTEQERTGNDSNGKRGRKFHGPYQIGLGDECGGFAERMKYDQNIVNNQYCDTCGMTYIFVKRILKFKDLYRIKNKVIKHDFIDDKDELFTVSKQIQEAAKIDIDKMDKLGQDWYGECTQILWHHIVQTIHFNIDLFDKDFTPGGSKIPLKFSFKFPAPMLSISGGFIRPGDVISMDTRSCEEHVKIVGEKLSSNSFYVFHIIHVFVLFLLFMFVVLVLILIILIH